MAMVTAKAEVTLPLSQFQPQSTLVTAEHHLERARFPVIDYHNHLDALAQLKSCASWMPAVSNGSSTSP